MILGHLWIDANNLSVDALTVLKLELNYSPVIRNQVLRIQE